MAFILKHEKLKLASPNLQRQVLTIILNLKKKKKKKRAVAFVALHVNLDGATVLAGIAV